jgi:hypothetical protein
MTAYHHAVADFPPSLIHVTDRYFRRRPWRSDWVTKAQAWLDTAADVYDLPAIGLVLTTRREAAGSGCYLATRNEIRMPKASVVTLFHEFRHAIQHHQPDEVWYRVDETTPAVEDDARAWSLSLFHQVRPQLLASAVEAGRVFYITHEDLT